MSNLAQGTDLKVALGAYKAGELPGICLIAVGGSRRRDFTVRQHQVSPVCRYTVVSLRLPTYVPQSYLV